MLTHTGVLEAESIRQHASAYVSIRRQCDTLQLPPTQAICQHAPACVSTREHMLTYVWLVCARANCALFVCGLFVLARTQAAAGGEQDIFRCLVANEAFAAALTVSPHTLPVSRTACMHEHDASPTAAALAGTRRFCEFFFIRAARRFCKHTRRGRSFMLHVPQE